MNGSMQDQGARVVVTAVGVTSPFGNDAATWAALRAGKTAVGMHELPGASGFPAIPSAPWLGESPLPFLTDRKLAKYMSPTASMAVIAAGRALAAAGMTDASMRAAMGLYVATGLIAFDLSSVQRAVTMSRSDDGTLDLQALGREGLRACHPLMPFKMLLNMPLGLVSIAYGLRGPNFATYPDVAQTGICLERAVRAIRLGRLPAALVGASVQGFSLMPVCTRISENRLAGDVDSCRPFSPHHTGSAPADAAAFLVIESEHHARARGCRPLAVLVDAASRWTAEERASHSGEGGKTPADLVITTGLRDRMDDDAELRVLGLTWPGGTPRLACFDGLWGDTGVASLLLAIGAGLQAMAPGDGRAARESAPGVEEGVVERLDQAQALGPSSVVVRAVSPGGARATATLAAWEATP